MYITRPFWYSKGFAYVGFFISGCVLCFNVHLTKEYVSREFGNAFGADYNFLFAWLLAIFICVYENVATTPVLTPAAWPWLLSVPERFSQMEPRQRPWYIIGAIFSLGFIYAIAICCYWLDWTATTTEMHHVQSVVIRRMLAAILVFVPEALVVASANALLTVKVSELKSLPAASEIDRHLERFRNFKEDVEDMKHEGRKVREVRRNNRRI